MRRTFRSSTLVLARVSRAVQAATDGSDGFQASLSGLFARPSCSPVSSRVVPPYLLFRIQCGGPAPEGWAGYQWQGSPRDTFHLSHCGHALGEQGPGSRWQKIHPGAHREAGPCVCFGSKSPAHASLSCQVSLTKYKLQGKIIKNFKLGMEGA